ncbi:MAG: 3-methyladenine DNA glycosylase [Nostocoides sp.]
MAGNSPVLGRPAWEAAEAAHHARVDALTAGHLSRRAVGEPHPVEDFLFTYYHHSPVQLRRWHPGPGVRLAGASSLPRADWAFYVTSPDDESLELDLPAYLAKRGSTIRFVRELLSRTAERPAQLGCFGLHEWAMVHRLGDDELRHRGWPLRLGPTGTDEVVETHRIKCSHVDAYRFFTDSAAPLNTLRPTRDTQVALEQPGCLHAGMDVYKWAFKLAPAIPSELTVDCFELARDIRELDMRASPYDFADLGYEPVAIETPVGKAAYVTAQRAFSERSNALRHRLLQAVDSVLDVSSQGTSR